jgi:hypothetical protein
MSGDLIVNQKTRYFKGKNAVFDVDNAGFSAILGQNQQKTPF